MEALWEIVTWVREIPVCLRFLPRSLPRRSRRRCWRSCWNPSRISPVKPLGASKSQWLRHKNGSFMGNCNMGEGNFGVFKVSASVAATEKPSTMLEIVLEPIKDISGTITLPGSKSLSNRILLLAALSEGTTVVDNLLYSEDIHYMLGALRTLGLRVEDDKTTKQATVEGCGGLFPTAREPKDEISLFLGNVGTAMRPLKAVVVAAGGNERRFRGRRLGQMFTNTVE